LSCNLTCSGKPNPDDNPKCKRAQRARDFVNSGKLDEVDKEKLAKRGAHEAITSEMLPLFGSHSLTRPLLTRLLSPAMLIGRGIDASSFQQLRTQMLA
jgi:hypothetical protein